MPQFRSLPNRIFLATALMTIVSIGLAIFVVNIFVSRRAEDELARGLEYAASLLEQNRDLLIEQLAREAQLVADLPKLKAAVAVDHPPTLAPIADDYGQQLGSDLFVVTNARGQILATNGYPYAIGQSVHDIPAIHTALDGGASITFWPRMGGGAQVVTVPIWIDPLRPELLGTLSIGFAVDQALATRFKALTDSEVVFVEDDTIHASTLPVDDPTSLVAFGRDPEPGWVRLGSEEYVARARPLSVGGDGPAPLVAVILRSRAERTAFLRSLQTALAGTGLIAVFAATLLSYAVARTVTRPVGAITATMREMAATGDLTTRISLPDHGRWTDDDAVMLAGTFNALTDSIGRFQREAAQRDRLSALGRLSTVIAHEIRNPLMIIKAAVRTLSRPSVAPADVSQAAEDINEEVARLNRIVGEVLDFARPIKFDHAPVSLNRLCTDAVEAVTADAGSPEITTDLDPAADRTITDGERLRLTLVNVLTNARQAVARSGGHSETSMPSAEGAPIRLKTDGHDKDRVAIIVRDQGVGISPEDLPKVFDPYFTTKRTGSGLGLAIARNVIEGLGGTITVESRVGDGTTMRIELPRNSDLANPGDSADGTR